MFVSRSNPEAARAQAQANADSNGKDWAYGSDTAGNWHAEPSITAPQHWDRVRSATTTNTQLATTMRCSLCGKSIQSLMLMAMLSDAGARVYPSPLNCKHVF